MNVVIKDSKLFIGDKYFCDTATIAVPKGMSPQLEIIIIQV